MLRPSRSGNALQEVSIVLTAVIVHRRKIVEAFTRDECDIESGTSVKLRGV